jgi:acetoin utilization deacetylase AcuC-like enzyme
MTRTGIVEDRRYMDHRADGYHPESHQRLEVIYQMLQDSDMKGKYSEISPRPADQEELELIHTSGYIRTVSATAGRAMTMLDPDTYACAQSYETAKLAAGGALEATAKVMEGAVDNAFCFIRPPGHHAEANRAMGFCLFNNVAIAAAAAIQSRKVRKAMIIDWDLHHGNGTQHSFYDRADVLYFSTHQYPYYPGTGAIRETGEKEGKGFTVNVPLPSGPGDGEYMHLFEEILEPIALAYKPELIFVSAGFDIYYRDPLGGMEVTPEGFANLARIILDFAQATCNGKVIFVLEGGYHLEGLRDSAKEVLKTMKGEVLAAGRREDLRQNLNSPMIAPIVKKVKETQKPFWKDL